MNHVRCLKELTYLTTTDTGFESKVCRKIELDFECLVHQTIFTECPEVHGSEEVTSFKIMSFPLAAMQP
jgi:hypothetical protein